MTAEAFTSSTIGLGGLSIHFTDWGDADGPPLVLLHGLSGHARTWDHNAAALSDRYRVLALDQRGHGDSGWATEYGSSAMAGDLLAFLDALGLNVITLAGLSMGGIVSFVFAGSHPERVRRLAVLDIGPEIATAGAAGVATTMAAQDTFGSEDEAFALARAANPRPTDAAIRHRVTHNLRPLPDGTLTYKYDAALRTPRAIFDHTGVELWDYWRAVSCPVLLIRGADSDILAAETAERMIAENANARLVTIPDCGHSITLERPEALQKVLDGWLQRQQLNPAPASRRPVMAWI
jgi:pimeloyl-ACP methyl ester carboxylesterase